MRNSPLFAHATNFWANRFDVCFFLKTKLFDKLVLLVRSKCFYKPNFLFWKWWILCFVWNIPSQGLGGRVLPLFWRKNFVFPSLIRSRELFFLTLSIFPCSNGLSQKRPHPSALEVGRCWLIPLWKRSAAASSIFPLHVHFANVWFFERDHVVLCFWKFAIRLTNLLCFFVECKVNHQGLKRLCHCRAQNRKHMLPLQLSWMPSSLGPFFVGYFKYAFSCICTWARRLHVEFFRCPRGSVCRW